MQVLAAVQAIPVSAADFAPLGVRGDSSVQALPFHRSAVVVTRCAPFSELPAATHALAVGQDTANSPVPTAPAGLRVAWMAHFAPFHRSARVTAWPVPLLRRSPTAVHAAAVAQETPRNPLTALSGGTGTLVIRQVLPFHTSASGTLPARVSYRPAATQSVALRQETPLNSAPIDPAGSGTVSRCQPVPLSAAASSRGVPLSFR